MRFLADVGISRRVVQTLRDREHNAIHLADENLQQLADVAVVEKARREGRVILIHDLDFSRLLAVSGNSSPSTVTFRLSSMRPENVAAHLLAVLEQFAQELERGAMVSVGDRASRCRTLPVHPAP